MANRRGAFVPAVACIVLLSGSLPAQDNPPQSQPGNPEIAGLPAARGVYYRSPNGWVALSSTVLMPMWDGKAAALEILNVGNDHANAKLPGAYSGSRIGDTARPAFYLRGIPAANLYLVRAVRKESWRELRMPISHNFWEWAHFRAKDLTPFELQSPASDVVALRPAADLKPGEYALASVLGEDYRWLKLGFDFAIASGRTGQ